MKIIHDSDCAVHNEPAYPNGPCDCGAEMVEAPEATNDNLRHELRECASELSLMTSERDHWKAKYEKEYDKVIATGIVAINSLPKREHITDGTPCWCNPETTYISPETDGEVIVHKEPQ